MIDFNRLSLTHSLKILPILLILFIFKAHGQENNSFDIDKLFTLHDNYLPDELLKTKSIVLIKMQESEDGHKRGDWKKLAKEIHRYIIERGIDPVWYFYFDDIYAGPDLSKSISNSLTTREIENVIIYEKINDRSHNLYITTFNKNEFFFTHGQECVKIHATTTAQINRNLAILIDRKDLISENLLFLDTPEYYNQSSLIRGKRFQLYAADLKLDKLAIPGLKSAGNTIIPENLPTDSKEREMFNILDSTQVNPVLLSLLKQYPFKYDFLASGFNEQAIRKKGYQFILLWLYNTTPEIQNMLKYPANAKEAKKTDNQKHLANSDLLVYKFYIKHIYTGDVYLGTTWDADTNWQIALQNYLEQLNKNINP